MLRYVSALLLLALAVDGGRALAQQITDLPVEEADARLARLLHEGLWEGEGGAWRTKVQLVLDPVTRTLKRQTVTVWDPMPSRDRDFTWVPSTRPALGKELASGKGRLIWRTRARPAYDPRSVVGIYEGDMVGGRPSGVGSFDDRAGVFYFGEWAEGNMQGAGHLKLPTGDEYQGAFLLGKPHGNGLYIDATGETFEGTYVDGRREGSARTVLPSGATYQSQWLDGAERPQSREVRLAQASGPLTGISPADDVRIAIIVNPINSRTFQADPPDGIDLGFYAEMALGYKGSNTANGIDIFPDKNRLVGMWKGNTEIQLLPDEENDRNFFFIKDEFSYGVFSYPRSLLPPVEITVEAQNRGNKSLQVSGLYLDVAESVTDRQPAIQMSIGHANDCNPTARFHKTYSPKITLENFGWGPAQNARLNFSFVDPASKGRPQNFSDVRSIGSIERIATVDFETELNRLGVDTRKLAARATQEPFQCGFSGDGSLDEKACISDLGGPDLFGRLADMVRVSGKIDTPEYHEEPGNLVTAIAGTLDYQWTDAGGAVHRRTSPFRERIWLGRVNFAAECGEGGAPTRVHFNPIHLALDKSAYRVPIPYRGTIPAGRVARYAVSLDSARASRHKFHVALQLADGQTVSSRAITLLYFRPSWHGTQN